MKKILPFDAKSFGLGLAIFSMFFGAGNIIFPLALGQYAGDKTLTAVFGLILTAVVMPVAGVVAMLLYDGDYRRFFGRLGKFPGLLLATAVISLLGPLGSTPRCIALSFTTLRTILPELDLVVFSAGACLLLFICTVRKRRILDILGWGLTPVLLALLLGIIVLGLMTPGTLPNVQESHGPLFLHGLSEGYNTMDLLAAFFFSSMVLGLLRSSSAEEPSLHQKRAQFGIALWASLLGAFLLAAIYVGFSVLAALHGHGLTIHGPEALLSAISHKIAGPYAGAMVCVTVALACLTTAIALLTAFTDFVHQELLEKRVRYEWVLVGAVLLTFVISTLEFRGIAAFLGPILQVCYPGLIVLTMLNILYRWRGVRFIKRPVFGTFAASAAAYLFF